MNKKSLLRASIWLLLLSMSTIVEAAYPKIIFSAPCISGQSLTLAAVGDVLLHRPLQEKAAQKGFQSLWQPLIPYLRSVDIAYANLEGPMAAGMTREGKLIASATKWDRNVYSDYPMFNYHPSLAQALKASGIAIVSTANNHALDRNGSGIDKTLSALQSVGIHYTGTRPKNTQQTFVSVIERKSFKIAFLACTEHTNGIDDYKKQVLYCYKKNDRAMILATIANLKNKVDAIVVTPHFGEEYEQFPNALQRGFAHQVLDAGALLVIGSHPHVLQPIEQYKTKDGRETLISYSLGNFVSYQGKTPKRTSMLLLIGLSKTGQGTRINGVKFAPLYMENRSGTNNLMVNFTSPFDHKAPNYDVISQVLPLDNGLDLRSASALPDCFQ